MTATDTHTDARPAADDTHPSWPRELCEATVEALARTQQMQDYRGELSQDEQGHVQRVTRLALRFAQLVEPELASLPQFEWGLRLHDIGMLGVAATTLAKKGPLTEDELEEVREHPWLGERIVAPLPFLNNVARQVIGFHHEKWDGSGYPRALSGDAIPVAARLFAIVDAFDAMTRHRLYRDALPVDAALEEIEAREGKHFDPRLARIFLRSSGDLLSQPSPAATL